MKKLAFALIGLSLLLSTTSCTPLLVCGAAAGGAYLGYKASEEGYSIKITKPVKGKKVDTNKDNSTSSE
ncbi:hypothetical protein [Hippea alviniae]|uniref:hypothetical protein n=1 Tax=Hippea alviniae TaxID=1279027 RepID=UPI0003B33D85|nr:hypothetical protein [Hippea alviniae]